MTTARRAGATSLTTLAACVVAFVLVNAFAPQWAQSAGLDFWEMPSAMDQQRFENDRLRQIEAQSETLADQIAAGESVAVAVIENRIGFQAGVDQILEINRERPGFREALTSQYFPTTDWRALHERYLEDKIRHRLADDPTRLADVMCRVSDR